MAIWCANLILEHIRSIIIFDSPVDLHRLIEGFSSEEAQKALVRNRERCGRPVEEVFKEFRNELSWKKDTLRVFAESYSLCDPRWFDPWIGDDGMEYFDGFDVDRCLEGVSCPAP